MSILQTDSSIISCIPIERYQLLLISYFALLRLDQEEITLCMLNSYQLGYFGCPTPPLRIGSTCPTIRQPSQ